MADSNPPSWLKDLSLFAIVISQVSGYTLGGIGLAYLAKIKWDVSPLWMVMGGLGGLVLAFYRIVQWMKHRNPS